MALYDLSFMQKPLCYVLCGIISHIFFLKRGEWHTLSSALVLFWSAMAIVVLIYESRETDMVAESGLSRGLVYLGLYYLSLLSSLLTYRIFWHPLRRFPGPRAAALSKLWHVYHTTNCQNHLLLDDLHHRFGTFVRTGMDRNSKVLILL